VSKSSLRIGRPFYCSENISPHDAAKGRTTRINSGKDFAFVEESTIIIVTFLSLLFRFVFDAAAKNERLRTI